MNNEPDEWGQFFAGSWLPSMSAIFALLAALACAACFGIYGCAAWEALR